MSLTVDFSKYAELLWYTGDIYASFNKTFSASANFFQLFASVNEFLASSTNLLYSALLYPLFDPNLPVVVNVSKNVNGSG